VAFSLRKRRGAPLSKLHKNWTTAVTQPALVEPAFGVFV